MIVNTTQQLTVKIEVADENHQSRLYRYRQRAADFIPKTLIDRDGIEKRWRIAKRWDKSV